MEKKTEILNVRLPEEIIKWIDSLVDNGIYNSRSEALRAFLREYLLDNRESLADLNLEEPAGETKGDYIG